MPLPLSRLAVLALLCAFAGCGGDVAPNRTDFTFLESPPASGSPYLPSLVHAPDGQPWIAYNDSKATQPRVAKWTGSAWEEVGTSPAAPQSGPTALTVQLAVSATGQPFLTERSDDSGSVRLRTFEGETWKNVSLIPSSGTPDLRAWDLRINPAGQPVLVTTTTQPGTVFGSIHVRTWTGSTWRDFHPEQGELPSPSGDGYGLHSPSMELSSDGNPLVAHLEGNLFFARLWVRRWTGTAWEILGGPLFSYDDFGHGAAPDLALDPEGRPYVVWATDRHISPPAGAVHVSRWTGTAWESVGDPITVPNTEGGVQQPLLQVDPQGRPVVSFRQGGCCEVPIHVRRWNGTSWASLGAPLTGLEKDALYSHAMSMGPEGVPLLAWPQAIGDFIFSPGRGVLYVARFNEGH
jgi:hypothetical protein